MKFALLPTTRNDEWHPVSITHGKWLLDTPSHVCLNRGERRLDCIYQMMRVVEFDFVIKNGRFETIKE